MVARSERNARTAVAALERQHSDTPFEVTVVDAAAGGEQAAGEAIAQAARGEADDLCIFLGDGFAPGPALVTAHVRAHESGSQVVAVGVPPHLVGEPIELRQPARGSLSLRRTALSQLPAQGAAPVAELILRLHDDGYEVRSTDDGGERAAPQRSHAALRERAAEGAAHAQLTVRNAAAMRLLLGWYADAPARELLLRRALLRLGATPGLVAAAGRVLPDGGDAERWWAWAANYAYWYGARRALPAETWARLARATPVLLYHAFGDGVTTSRFVCRTESLARQMRILSILRYDVISFDELCGFLHSGTPPPRRTAVVTADDGYVDNQALTGALARHGFGGTIFLVSDRLGGTVDWTDDRGLAGRPLLSAEQARELRRDGVELGAHTRTHVSLPDAADETIDDEVKGSQTALERALGGTVTTFAYPFGACDARAVAATRHAGFKGACTVAGRLARISDDPFAVPRIEIERADTPARFLRKLWFGAAP